MTRREATEQARKMCKKGLYPAAVALMDDEIRELLHEELTGVDEIVFLREYIKEHYKKYQEVFTV